MTGDATLATLVLVLGLLFAAAVAFAVPLAMVAFLIWGG